MAWNEPGGGRNRDSNRDSDRDSNRDPWGNRGSGNDGGPPDLDEALRKAKQRLGAMFGRGKRGGNGSGNGHGGASGGGVSPTVAWAALAVAILIWLASGFYIVDAGQRGVVTRFGAFATEAGPGPHWHMPWPISQLRTVNVARNRSLSLETQSMLTQDENVVVLDMSVQYDVKDARAFLFQVRQPEETLYQVIESVLRAAVGDNKMDFIITKGRGQVAERTLKEAQDIIDAYGTGLNIQAVNLQNAQPPEPVQPAYEDAITAREDQQRFINEARAVQNRVVPTARGQAAETVQQAKAYKNRVVESARGDVSRFNALLAEYQQAPEVTRKRLYLDTMQKVLSNTGKVLVDRKGEGRNMIYLPLDRMSDRPLQSGGDSGASTMPSASVKGAANSSNDSSRGDRPQRSRGTIQ